ncbi:MAG: hypothetical protein D6762_06160, partial [Candidatus Neomarinimicrobiota bacterium]
TLALAQPPRQNGAGRPQGPPPLPDQTQITAMVNELSTDLSLSEEQQARILSLYKDHFQEVEAKLSGSQRPDREEMEALRQAFESRVKAVLTKKQAKQFDNLMKRQHSRPPKR